MACVKVCPKVCPKMCPNLARGYCSWVECPYPHDVFALGDGVYNLTFYHALWVNLGKSRVITTQMREKIVAVIGEYHRVDFVDMPERGGSYICAVVFFNTITPEARDKLLSGNCIWIKHESARASFRKQIRFTLFRSKVMSKEAIRAKQMAKKASIQAQKVIADVTDRLAWLPFEVNTEKEVWDGAMDWSTR